MPDLLFAMLALVFFVASLGYLAWCGRM